MADKIKKNSSWVRQEDIDSVKAFLIKNVYGPIFAEIEAHNKKMTK